MPGDADGCLGAQQRQRAPRRLAQSYSGSSGRSPEVWVSSCAHGDAVLGGRREVGQVRAHPRVHAQRAALELLHRGHRREQLGEGGQVEGRVHASSGRARSAGSSTPASVLGS